MKYIHALCSLMLLANMQAGAQSAVMLAKGSVLRYNVLDGARGFKLKATITAYTDDSGPLSLSWQTSGARIMNGTVNITGSAREYAAYFIHKPVAGNKKFGDDSLQFFLSSVVCDDLEDQGTILTQDAFGLHSMSSAKLPVGKSVILYNKKQVVAALYSLVPQSYGDPEMCVAALDDGYLVTFYKTKDYEMKLVSITTPLPAVSLPETSLGTFFADAQKNTKLLSMDKTKLALVAKKYPVLASLEQYDPTMGGKVKKPFNETYDYRISSQTFVPPTLIDCFLADIAIVAGSGFATSSHDIPSAAVEAAISKYQSEGASDVAGYRPWANWSFVRSLSEKDRTALVTEVTAYATEYGYTDQ